jgi:hypothetical protein
MKRNGTVIGSMILAVICLSVVAAEPPAFTGKISPFAYCASVGTTDSPAGTTGPSPIPPALEPYLHDSLGTPTDAELAPGSVYWRCMDGAVYVCATGANLVCDRTADRATTNPGADSYCKDNPDAAVVPAYAAGHDSTYVWHCAAARARYGPPVAKLDRRGFRIEIWHKILRPRAVMTPPTQVPKIVFTRNGVRGLFHGQRPAARRSDVV